MVARMKTILDPSFRYTASFDTNLKKTFARVRRDHRLALKRAAPALNLVNVSSIINRTAKSA
jgi:hypothetical protein